MADINNVYMVGQVRALAHPVTGYEMGQPMIWELSGIFASEREAVEACRDETYFVAGPIGIGDQASQDTDLGMWPSWFPHPRGKVVLPGEPGWFEHQVKTRLINEKADAHEAKPDVPPTDRLA